MDDQTQMIVTILAVLVGLILVGIWFRRDNVFYNLRKLLVCVLFGALVGWLFWQNPAFQPAAPLIGIIVAGLSYGLRPPRKRHIRVSVRRQVVAKWTAKTGKKFDPRFYEIDHIVPFSKGGSDTADNLRVIEKKTNRSKGAKSPWWDIMGRR